MPAIKSGRVLVTGANGFLAAWVVKELLEHGFSVRGTVRSESKAAYLREYFKAHGDRFETAIVEDISKEGAFEAAAKGVDAIMHIASAVLMNADDPDDVIIPAVNARPHHVLDRRGLEPPPPGQEALPRPLDESDWNEYSVALVQEKGRAAPGPEKYRAAKTLAERAAWDTYERAKADSGEGGLPWDLVVLNSPFIFGPIVHEAPTLESFGGTARYWLNSVVLAQAQGDALTKNGWAFVDVRDLARGHFLGLTVPEAGGERLLISGHRYVWQHFVDVAHRWDEKLPAGDPSFKEDGVVYSVEYNREKSQRVLGMKYRTLEETTKDTLEDYRGRGWL
ncbi:NAD(P)-binding protein [Daedaleopsis nitida]|nr:NAD(P)-binding protein [Daedaleopsis nitida]